MMLTVRWQTKTLVVIASRVLLPSSLSLPATRSDELMIAPVCIVGMNSECTHEMRSRAIGWRIAAVRYDLQCGLRRNRLDSGDELWVTACYGRASTSELIPPVLE